MSSGLFNLPWWGVIAVILVFTHITILAVTIYLHRHQAHKALSLHPLVALFFRIWLWLTTGMTTKTWTAIHRKHHAHVDAEADPHSPQIYGLAKVLGEGAELYRKAGKDSAIIQKYGHGTPDDWFERHIFAPHDRIGIFTMLVINLWLFGPIGLTIWAIQMMWIPLFAAGVINGVGHWRGYRNFETADASTNITPWGIVIGGEELHNNHHAFASSACFASKPWEVDIGWYYICGLQWLKLAEVKKTAPVLSRDRETPVIDLDTVSAMITGRFYVMADYAKQVINQVYREELREAQRTERELLKPVRRLLIREQTLMNEEQRSLLAKGLEQSNALSVVYDFRQQLQAIFAARSATQKELLAQIQAWCQRAEATGIQALEDFSMTIRCYTQVLARP